MNIIKDIVARIVGENVVYALAPGKILGAVYVLIVAVVA